LNSTLAPMEVVVGGKRTFVDNTLSATAPAVEPLTVSLPDRPDGPTRPVPLGALFGARSGDKGPNANLGIFSRSAAAFVWLSDFLTVDCLKSLMPEAADLDVDRYDFPNLWSLNFILHGLLEEGVAASTRQDPQAKALGEYLRAKIVDIPEVLLR